VPQVVLVDIGATVCALVPVTGRPVALVPSWQVVQVVAAVTVTLEWNVVGQAVVVLWQLEHWA
jgi:hypothetical protein